MILTLCPHCNEEIVGGVKFVTLCDGCQKPIEITGEPPVYVTVGNSMNARQFQFHPDCAPDIAKKT